MDYWDTKTRSFGIRVNRNAKTFVAKLNNKRLTIGEYPQWSLAKAREKAFSFKADKATATAKRLTMTVQDAYDAFEKVHIPTLSLRGQHEMKRLINKHLLPKLKKKKLADVMHGDISDITDALVPTPSTAWHAFKDFRTFFKWCVPRYIPHSPMEGLKAPTKYIARKRVLTDAELRRVWIAAGDLGYPFGKALQLALLWGCRWGEVVSCRRSFIDTQARTVTLPVTKNKTEHHFPIGKITVEILATIPSFKSTDLLFPGRDLQSPWNGSGKSKWLFDKANPMDHWQILDLRRTFGTKLATLRTPPHIVERLLNHKMGSISNRGEGVVTAIAEVYNRHIYMDEMREAIDKWEDFLRRVLRGSQKVAA